MLKYLAIAIVLLISACAKQPEEIAAADIGPNPYTRFSCKSLSAENLRQQQKLANLSAEQKSAASGDVIGVLLIGVPVSSVAGNDKETAIAIAKGRIQAIQTARETKSCR